MDNSGNSPWEGASGAVLARGVARYLAELGFVSVPEVVPQRGLRVDVMALGPKGEIWIVECKSSRADFLSDRKWSGYLPWCDRFYWAVGRDFDLDLLPEDGGIIIADGYGAEGLRDAPAQHLSPARRRKLTRTFARTAARRLQQLCDPMQP